jgi:hypothetical protein
MLPAMPKAKWSSVRLGAVTLLAAASLASAPAPASAQPMKDLTQLRQIFSDGRQLEENKNWAGALEKFKEVAAAKMTPQVRFHIALCEEKLGRLASAKHGFELAAAEAAAAGSAAAEVPTAAKEHIDDLAGRVAKLRIQVKGKLKTSKIALDDRVLAEADLAADIEVDPGTHAVEVRDAAGAKTFRKELSLEEKGEGSVEVTVADRDEPPPPPPGGSPGPSRVPAYVTGAVGAAALITSGVFFGLRASTIATITSHCRDQVALTGCQVSDAPLYTQGKTDTYVADALLGIGAAGLATGVILFFVLAPKRDPKPTAVSQALRGATLAQSLAPPPRRAVWISPTGSGVRLSGSF